MARLIRHEQNGPYRIDPADFPKDGKAIFICGCGLSRRMPYCDGTHKEACRVEQQGVLYVYDAKTGQVVEQRQDGTPPATAGPMAT
ncbi:MAG: CDGSH iron-sulfur domain-containing protein [Phycisphaerales bacterium]